MRTTTEGAIMLCTPNQTADVSWMLDLQRSVDGVNWSTLPNEFTTSGAGMREMLMALPSPPPLPAAPLVPGGIWVEPTEADPVLTISLTRYANGQVTAGAPGTGLWIVPIALAPDGLINGGPLGFSNVRMGVGRPQVGGVWVDGIAPHWLSVSGGLNSSTTPYITPDFYLQPGEPALRTRWTAEIVEVEPKLIESILRPQRTAARQLTFLIEPLANHTPPQALVQWQTAGGTAIACLADLDLSHPAFPGQSASGMTDWLTPTTSPSTGGERVRISALVLPGRTWLPRFSQLPHPLAGSTATSGPTLSLPAEQEYTALYGQRSTLAWLLLSHRLPPQPITPEALSDQLPTTRQFIRSLPRPGMGYHDFGNGCTNVFQYNPSTYNPALATPIITEVCASNDGSVQTPDAAGAMINPDWIEIYNPSTTAVLDLTGYYLTHLSAAPLWWQFPAMTPPITIPAGGLLVVYASSKNFISPTGAIHTNFTISKEHPYVRLSNPLGLKQAEITVPSPTGVGPILQADWSYGYYVDANGTPAFGYFPQATPGTHNVTKAYVGQASPAKVSLWHETAVEGGGVELTMIPQEGGAYLDRADGPYYVFFQPQSGWLTAAQLAAGQRQQEVTYTTNCAEPSAYSYVGSPGMQPLTTSTTFRTRCQAADCLPGDISSYCFLFRDEVVGPAVVPGPNAIADYPDLFDSQLTSPEFFHLGQRQPTYYPDLLFGASVSNRSRYDFDQRVLAERRDPQPIGNGQLDEGILPLTSSLPTFFVTAPPLGLFASQPPVGVYYNLSQPVSATVGYIPPGSNLVSTQVSATLSVSHHSWRLEFGENLSKVGRFNASLYESASNQRQTFTGLNLRYPDVDGLLPMSDGSGASHTFCRDAWCVETSQLMNTANAGPHRDQEHAVRWVNLYLNGLYWGIYNAAERLDKAFLSSRFGKAKVKSNHTEYTFGNNADDFEAYDNSGDDLPAATAAPDVAACTAAAALLPGQESHALWQAVLQRVDVDSLMNYHLLRCFYGDDNWQSGAKFGRRLPSSPLSEGDHAWRFFCWDTENGALQALPEIWQDEFLTSGDYALGISLINALMPCALFKEKMWQRAQALLSPNGLLHQSTTIPRWHAITQNFRKVFWNEAARALTTHRAPGNNLTVLDLVAAWNAETAKVDYMLNHRSAPFLKHVGQWLGKLPPDDE